MNYGMQQVGVSAFSDWGFVGAAGDPEIYSTLTSAQQGWVDGGLANLKARTVAAGQTWPPVPGSPDGTRPAMVGGFQQVYNATVAKTSPVKPLRTDGLLDQDTLDALQSAVGAAGGSPYPTTAPGQPSPPSPPAPPGAPVAPTAPSAPTAATCPKGQKIDPKTGQCIPDELSTGAIVGIAAGGAVLVGGVYYLATRKPKKKRKKGR